jgi:hypothetical protein
VAEANPEVVKLKASLLKLEGSLSDVTKERDAIKKDAEKLRSMNKAGDEEYRKLSAALNKSKDAKEAATAAKH